MQGKSRSKDNTKGIFHYTEYPFIYFVVRQNNRLAAVS